MSSPGTVENVLKLSFSEDRLECRALIASGADRSGLDRGAIVASLNGKGVVNECIDHDGIARFMTRAPRVRDEEVSEVVARGRAPESGIPGHFEFAAEIQRQFDEIERREHVLRHAPPLASTGVSRKPGADDTDIDFYEVSAFVIVRNGAMIGTVLEPTKGVDGIGVRGETLPAESGELAAIQLGEGLDVIGRSEVRAAIDGRLVRAVGEIRVEEVLRVKDAVDFSTGNIDFPGDVLVNSGVKDRFRVRSDGDIEIRDLVEAAHIETPYNVNFITGMAGREAGTLAVGRDLTSRYLDGVRGSIDGVCRVAREINACDLLIGSRLECPAGAVMGGRVRVAGGCDVGQLGGPGGLETELVLGWVEEIERASRDLLSLIDARVPPPPSKAKPRKEDVRALLQAAERVQTAQDRVSSVSLTVQKAMYPGARIIGRGWVAEITAPVEGPLLIEVDDTGEPVFRALPRGEETPLARVAHVGPSDAMAVLDAALDRLNAAD
ncbi:MAG: FapA family protein [Planctomycetota bacterium]